MDNCWWIGFIYGYCMDFLIKICLIIYFVLFVLCVIFVNGANKDRDI